MIVTVIALVGTMPYIALQLKAVSSTFAVLVNYDRFADLGRDACRASRPAILTDAAFLTAVGMAIFAILFGTRHIDANEHHEGMVAAIAFESCVKLLAFLAVGIFVVVAFGPGLGSDRRDRHGAARATSPRLPEGDAPPLPDHDVPVDGGDRLPAAPVPHRHRRERR